MRPVGFVIGTAILCLVGGSVVARAGWGARPIATGMLLAWLVHVAAFVLMARDFSAGRMVMTAWVGGMISRLVALGVMWYLSAAGMIGRALAQAFVFTLIVLVLFEALWLSLVASRTRSTEG